MTMKFRVEIETDDDAAQDKNAYNVIIRALMDVIHDMEMHEGFFDYKIKNKNGDVIGYTYFFEKD
jgi:hypothetical protein